MGQRAGGGLPVYQGLFHGRPGRKPEDPGSGILRHHPHGEGEVMQLVKMGNPRPAKKTIGTW